MARRRPLLSLPGRAAQLADLLLLGPACSRFSAAVGAVLATKHELFRRRGMSVPAPAPGNISPSARVHDTRRARRRTSQPPVAVVCSPAVDRAP